MPCTTILVGKNASYDGSTMIARNDDSGSGHFTAKKLAVFQPKDYPAVYKSVISGVEIPLPAGGLRMTAVPNAVEGKGLWAASGVNAANVGMTATETITSNPRVLGADPLVKWGAGGGRGTRQAACGAGAWGRGGVRRGRDGGVAGAAGGGGGWPGARRWCVGRRPRGGARGVPDGGGGQAEALRARPA